MQGDATATTAAFNLTDYAEPTAYLVILGLFTWFVTKAAPLWLEKRDKQVAESLAREDKIREASMSAERDARDAFLSELRYHHDQFTANIADARKLFSDELHQHRAQSKTLANEGHAAVEKLARSFDDLEKTFRQLIDTIPEHHNA